jgi:O-methyltransferase involved in polyketide biosynthesis
MKPISRTAFYCTGVRALDARTPRPICGDRYAERFMDEEAWRSFEPFRQFRGPNAPQVFDWKEPRLPAAECPNPLTRLAVDFAAERLADRLSPFADAGPVAIVIEGVLLYLDETRIRELLHAVKQAFPKGEIICDVMTREFFEKYSRPIHEKIQQLGASFTIPDRPIAEVFADEGYEQTAQISMTVRAAHLGQLPWFMRVLVRVSATFRNGYSVRVFEPQ